MRTESQDKRYRDGYAAGQRDGSFDPGGKIGPEMRSTIGDEWSDAGYSAGFSDGRDSGRDGIVHQAIDLCKGVFWLPQLSGWIKRHAGQSR